jgi:hypothetical protein
MQQDPSRSSNNAFHIGESGVPEDEVSFVDDDDDPPAPNDNLDVITAKACRS